MISWPAFASSSPTTKYPKMPGLLLTFHWPEPSKISVAVAKPLLVYVLTLLYVALLFTVPVTTIVPPPSTVNIVPGQH